MEGEVGDAALLLALSMNVNAQEALLMPAIERQNAQDLHILKKLYHKTAPKVEQWASAVIRRCSFTKMCSLRSPYKRSDTDMAADYTLVGVCRHEHKYERNTKSLDEKRSALAVW